jgi:hypothetical protein
MWASLVRVSLRSEASFAIEHFYCRPGRRAALAPSVPGRYIPFVHGSSAMRAELQNVADAVQQSLALLRRYL